MNGADGAKTIRDFYGCEATHRETVHVREVYRGWVFWEGEVGVFDLDGHPSAARAYVFRFEGENGAASVYPVLHAGLVDSPQSAVRAMVVHEVTSRER
jgi:hypothetical protein